MNPKITVETINGRKCTVIRRPFDAEFAKEQLGIRMPVVAEYDEWHRGVLGRTGITLTYYNGFGFGGLEGDKKDFLYNENLSAARLESILTILPALPRHPKPEHAPLLYRYASEGIFAYGKKKYSNDKKPVDWFWGLLPIEANPFHKQIEITHATHNGERVEIAIEDSHDPK